VVGSTTVPLDAEDVRLRASETNLGDYIADAVRAATHADIALLNSGAIRGNRVYPPGPLTRRTLLGMHPFGNVVCTIAVSGRVVLSALNSGVSKLPAAAGQFPQVSGLRMTVDVTKPAGSRVSDVTIGGRPLDPGATYTVALPDYVLAGGDNYTMFAGQRALVSAEMGDLLVTTLEHAVAAQPAIAPQTDGRINILR